MPITDYNKKKPLEISSTNDSGTTQDKAQPILVTGGDDSTTGTGDIAVDFTNISDAQDIAVYDENGNLLDYEIESLDTAAETGVIWAYNSWTRDDSVQAQIAYGDNSANTDRQYVTGTWENIGQNASLAMHDPSTGIDSTSNNNDATVTGVTSIDNGQLDGAGNFDGTDDYTEVSDDTTLNPEDQDFTVIAWVKTSNAPDDTRSLVEESIGGGRADRSIGIVLDSRTGMGPSGNEVFGHVDDGSTAIFPRADVNFADGNWHLTVLTWDASTGEGTMTVDETSGSATDNSIGSIDFSNPLWIGKNSKENTQGDIDEVRFYKGREFSSDEIQAEYDASPKAGQVYFSQQAAEATVTDQIVTVPETTTSSTNPDPQINATVDVSVPTSTATTVNPAATVSPGAAPLNVTATTSNTVNPDFTVQPGNSTVQTPVSTATVSNPDPQVNAFNEITVPETDVATFNPAPTLTVGQTIITPETTVTSSNPDLTLQPGETSLNISTTQVLATNPEFGLNRQIVVGVATNLSSENPEPNLQPGAVSVEVPETSILTENPALQLQPGATSLQIQQATNLQTVNPEFSTVSGATELQLSETQLTASVQEPSIGLTLEFVSPTNALITNDERFFDMPDHTFTEGDLGDTLQAVLKTDASPDGVDLTGATEIKLVVKDRDGVKVFDKEMSISDSSTGQVEYKWSQGDFIEEPGVYRSKIKVFDSTGEPESFPNDGFRTIEIEEEIG